jgi:hypothetical protein
VTRLTGARIHETIESCGSDPTTAGFDAKDMGDRGCSNVILLAIMKLPLLSLNEAKFRESFSMGALS